jgi:predicted nucleic acid-binding protein
MVSDKQTLLDSNIWIARLNREDSQHAKALAVFQSLEEKASMIVLPEYIIVEVYTQ